MREVRDHLAANRFVLRTDVKSYYASINHVLLIDQLAAYIRDRPTPPIREERSTLPIENQSFVSNGEGAFIPAFSFPGFDSISGVILAKH